MGLSKLAQRTLAGLQRTLQKIKSRGAKGTKITHLSYTRDKQGDYHHIYKVGKNLVSQNKVIGKVKKGQRFVEAMNGQALVKSITTDPYAKLLKGKKTKSQLMAIAKKVAQQKVHRNYVMTTLHNAARRAN